MWTIQGYGLVQFEEAEAVVKALALDGTAMVRRRKIWLQLLGRVLVCFVGRDYVRTFECMSGERGRETWRKVRINIAVCMRGLVRERASKKSFLMVHLVDGAQSCYDGVVLHEG